MDMLVLPSPVRKPRLLISFWTTKFCSSLLKFCVAIQQIREAVATNNDKKQWIDQNPVGFGGRPGETYAGLAPEDEDLRHHPEELCGVSVGLLQPLGPVWGGEEGERATVRLRLRTIDPGVP